MPRPTPIDVPTYSLPDHNRQAILQTRPVAIPQASDFVLAKSTRPIPGPGQILVRNIYLSVDPAQRGWASSEPNYSAPVPLGDVMRALAVGVVIESHSSEFEPGRFVYGWFGWQDYAAVDASTVITPIDHAVPLSAAASLLGINGLTAYLALTDLGRPRPGETLLVSTAAGSVGGFVGQIGKILGCRTIGLTGGAEKTARCVSRYGYTQAFDYKAVDVEQTLRDAAPQGLDIYYDNVGGGILDAALRQMRTGGRIVQCGTASIAAWTPPPSGPRQEREILTRRLSWNGFVVFDHAGRFEEAARQLAAWWSEGLIVYDEDIAEGLEAAPASISALYAGENQGKKLIYIGE